MARAAFRVISPINFNAMTDTNYGVSRADIHVARRCWGNVERSAADCGIYAMILPLTPIGPPTNVRPDRWRFPESEPPQSCGVVCRLFQVGRKVRILRECCVDPTCRSGCEGVLCNLPYVG